MKFIDNAYKEVAVLASQGIAFDDMPTWVRRRIHFQIFIWNLQMPYKYIKFRTLSLGLKGIWSVHLLTLILIL